MLRSLCAYHIVPALSICVRVSKAYVTEGITSVSLFSLGWLNSTVCRVCQDNNNQISVTSSVCQAAFGWTLSISTTDVLLSNSSQSAQKAGLQFFSPSLLQTRALLSVLVAGWGHLFFSRSTACSCLCASVVIHVLTPWPPSQDGVSYEVRRYDNGKFATISSEGRTFDQVSGELVRRLLMYVGGSNDQGQPTITTQSCL